MRLLATLELREYIYRQVNNFFPIAADFLYSAIDNALRLAARRALYLFQRVKIWQSYFQCSTFAFYPLHADM
jgi:hypothetical protein